MYMENSKLLLSFSTPCSLFLFVNLFENITPVHVSEDLQKKIVKYLVTC